jgi:hypothetical protein
MTAETPRSAAPELPTAPAGPQVDREPTPTTNGPETANLDAVVRIGTFLDTWKPYRGGRSLANHGGKHLFLGDLRALMDERKSIESLIAAQVDAALGEVEQRIQVLPCPGSPPAPLAKYAFDTAVDHAVIAIRDYRKQQNR